MPGPGVLVSTATRSGPVVPQRAAAAPLMMVGIAERGNTDTYIDLRSMADYERLLGARVSYGVLYDHCKTFFEEGGGLVRVARIVGGAATKASRILMDRAGTPLQTLRIEAKDPGAWGTALTVAVANGTLANTFKLTIVYTGTGGAGTEVWDNLASPAAAVTALNGSEYVRAVDLGSATAATNNNPAVLAASALSTGGADDRASIVTATYTAALSRFTPDLGAGAVAIPGQTSTNVGAALIAHAKANNRIALLATASGQTSAQAITAADALRATSGAEHAGLFWPWVRIPDGSNGTILISPESYAAACRARAHEIEGPHRAPAGDIARAQFIASVETDVDKTTHETLNASAVNVTRTVAGALRLYGWRSLSTDTVNYSLLTHRDVMNYVAVQAQSIMEIFVFRTIDGTGRLFAEINAALVGLLEPIRNSGGFYAKVVDGEEIDPGYRVETGESVNTTATIANNEARAEVSIRVSPSAELVRVALAKVGLTASV